MQFVTLICGFVLPRLILESYGSEVNGLTQSIKQFLGVIAFLELGVGQVIQSSLYKPLAQKDTEQISKILVSGNRFFRNIARVLLVYVCALIIVFPFLGEQDFGWAYTATLILAMCISSFAQYYFGIIDNLLLNADQKGYIQYISQIVLILLNTIVSVWMIREGYSIQSVKLISSLLFLIRPIIVRYYIRQNYQINRKIQYIGEPIRQKWNGIAQHVATIVLEGTDSIVLTIFATLSDVSVYSVYYMVIAGVLALYQSLTAGIQSVVGALWAKQQIDRLKKVFSMIEMALHFLTIFMFSCVALLIVPFVQVYTNGLTDANYIKPVFAYVLVIAYTVRCLRTPYNILILAGGHYKQTQKCHIIAAVLNIVISIAAVSLWGLIGIAMGTLVALAYQTGWMMVYDSKHLLCWSFKNIIKQLSIDAVTMGLIFAIAGWIKLGEISYIGWFFMAMPVALIALSVTVIMAMLFYRRTMLEVISAFVRKIKK